MTTCWALDSLSERQQGRSPTAPLGERGIRGAEAAVATAVFNATGVRVRDYPITLDKVLPALPRPGV